jgi:hypothetical protein
MHASLHPSQHLDDVDAPASTGAVIMLTDQQKQEEERLQ